MGICGTMMSHVALLLKEMGYRVCGSDHKFIDPIAKMLKEQAIPTFEGYEVDRLKALRPDAVIIGNVISRGNVEVEFLLNTKVFPFYSFPEFLEKLLFKKRPMVVVSGTHGKTTTTSALAFLLKERLNAGYLIGGIPNNFETGCALGAEDAPFIIEGDEYDTAFFDKRSKFFHYWPDTLIVNAIEFDHSDIFRDLQEIQRSFYQLTRLLPKYGHLILNGDDPKVNALLPCDWTQIHSVGFSEHNQWIIHNFNMKNFHISFDLYRDKQLIYEHVEAPLLGEFNARNLAMACVACYENRWKINPYDLKQFYGVKRRQTLLVKEENFILYEDFGHHPTAIQATLKSFKMAYPDHKLVAVFEPACNTSASHYFEEQALRAFESAHEVWLLPPKQHLYSDRFIDSPKPLNCGKLCEQLKNAGYLTSNLASYEALFQALKSQNFSEKTLICCFSNGSLSENLKAFSIPSS